MKKKKPILLRILGWVAILAGVVAVLLYGVLPAGMGIVTVLPGKSEVGAPPAGFTDVSLRAEDGVNLKAWYLPPRNGTVILLLHGAGGSRESMRPYAEMLARHDYGVLALDLRGHGQSEGATNRLGWQGTLDVGAGMRFLREQKGVLRIGGLGSSMGAEVLLGAASTYPELRAIAADGATRRCMDEYTALEENRSFEHRFTVGVMFATVQALSGQQPPLPLLDSMRTAQATRFLFIAAGANDLEMAFNRLFATTLAGRSDLWIAPGASHTGAFSMYPQEYEQKTVAFFATALGE